MTPRPLLLLGAGGLAREALAAVRTVPETWAPVGVLDDNPAYHGKDIDGLPVLGDTGVVHDHLDAMVLVCIAGVRNPGARARVVQRLGLPAERWATVVHPAASIAAGTRIGAGSVLLAHVVVTAPQDIGRHVVVMPHALLTHDDQMDDFVTLAGRATLAGTLHIGVGVYVGQGAMIRENLKIGAGAVAGMGSVVLSDVPAGETWAGVPARKIGDR